MFPCAWIDWAREMASGYINICEILLLLVNWDFSWKDIIIFDSIHSTEKVACVVGINKAHSYTPGWNSLPNLVVSPKNKLLLRKTLRFFSSCMFDQEVSWSLKRSLDKSFLTIIFNSPISWVIFPLKRLFENFILIRLFNLTMSLGIFPLGVLKLRSSSSKLWRLITTDSRSVAFFSCAKKHSYWIKIKRRYFYLIRMFLRAGKKQLIWSL